MIGRLWRTARHLKMSQIVGRVIFRLTRPRADMRQAPPRRAMRGTWVPAARREQSLVGPSRWRFLNVEGELGEIGWDDSRRDKLWRYNQHYFDDLNARDAETRRDWQRVLVSQWIARNPPGVGTAWEPYPTSLRIVNWIKWWFSGEPVDAAAVQSLAVQVRWLRRRLEWHLLGNHLFVNAKALVFAGLFFDGPEAEEWLSCGIEILSRELPEQVLQDGGQFERSPMYHALAVEDVLDLINLIRMSGREHSATTLLLEACEQRMPLMLHWLRCMSHPDGRIAFFNDAAHGIAPVNEEITRYAAALRTEFGDVQTGTTRLFPSGYVRVERHPVSAILDIAPLGPDYLPGHGHADTLSFELSVRGRRLIVNTGTSCYGLSERRLEERGTAAHSTVQVEDVNSSEVWSSFRVGRRARPINVQVSERVIKAGHDGYCWLRGSPIHRREWRFDDDVLTLNDEVVGGTYSSLARFHLAPGIEVEHVDGGRWDVSLEGELLARVEIRTGQGHWASSTYASEFGRVESSMMLQVQLDGGRASTRWYWH